jgi:hypothetical protein
MTDNRPPGNRSQGNLGQKVAEQEKTSDEKLEHMDDETSRPSHKRKESKDQTRRHASA